MNYKNFYALFLLLFLFLFLANSYAQKQKVPIVLNYENSSGEKGISIYAYDGNMRLIKGRWQLIDTSRWSTNYYRYNTKNQLIENYREFSDSITSSLKYKYNHRGDKIAEVFSRSDGVYGESTFEYNENGKLLKIQCNKYSGWFDGEIIYTKELNNKPLSAEIIRDGKKLGTIELKYCEDGQLKTEKWITPNWNQTFNWVYSQLQTSYTSSNIFIPENSRFRLNAETYSYNDETGGPSYFTYDKSGKLAKKTFVRSDSLKTETFYEYTPDGILTSSKRNYNNGETAEFTYKYNSKRQLTQRICKHSNGKTSKENYSYSEDGKLIEAVMENFDFWLSGKITFTTAKNGNLKSGKFKGEKFDALLTFEYDNFGNLSKIIWSFSFGKTQTYEFSYKDIYTL